MVAGGRPGETGGLHGMPPGGGGGDHLSSMAGEGRQGRGADEGGGGPARWEGGGRDAE